jgi:hypothetical protein
MVYLNSEITDKSQINNLFIIRFIFICLKNIINLLFK